MTLEILRIASFSVSNGVILPLSKRKDKKTSIND